MADTQYVMGRPDLADHEFGWTTVKRHPKYVYSTSCNGMLIHKVLRVRQHWYEAQMDRLLRLESPSIIAETVCNQHFFIYLPRHKRKFRASLCELPKPDAVLCGRCHGEPATFGKHGKPPCSKELAKIRLGCLQKGMNVGHE